MFPRPIAVFGLIIGIFGLVSLLTPLGYDFGDSFIFKSIWFVLTVGCIVSCVFSLFVDTINRNISNTRR